MKAIAYLNWGRWVADCPNPACTNALKVEPGQQDWECVYTTGPRDYPRTEGCRTRATLEWPTNIDDINRRTADLPESQRHWTPDEDNR
jgi:hypothetical protein